MISRFVAKEWFVASEVERRGYLMLLGKALERSDWRCLSYAIMSSHVHLCFVAGRQPMRCWMRPLHTDFARWLNERRERIGAVFVRGPNVVELRPEGALHVLSYVHDNPVRAGVVRRAHESDWTSHRAYVGIAPRPPWLHVELGLALAGLDSGRALDASMARASASRADLERLRARPIRPRGRPRVEPGPSPVPSSWELGG